jgi:hypothetical protein
MLQSVGNAVPHDSSMRPADGFVFDNSVPVVVLAVRRLSILWTCSPVHVLNWPATLHAVYSIQTSRSIVRCLHVVPFIIEHLLESWNANVRN